MRRCLVSAMFLLCVCVLTSAQEITGTIVGTVKESTGAYFLARTVPSPTPTATLLSGL